MKISNKGKANIVNNQIKGVARSAECACTVQSTQRQSGLNVHTPHKILTAVLVVLLAVTMVLGGISLSYASTNTIQYRDSATTLASTVVNGAKQGTDGSTFAKDGPVNNIFIDNDIVNNPNNAILKILPAGTSAGLVAKTTKQIAERNGSLSYSSQNDNMARLNGQNDGGAGCIWVVYDSSVGGTLQPNQDNYISGELFSYTYPNAAILSDGSRADVVVTYSELNLVIQDNLNSDFVGFDWVTIATANEIYCGYTAPGRMVSRNASTDHSRIGLEVGVNIQVTDPNTGAPEEGTFLYPMTDIDQNKTTSTDALQHLYNGVKNNAYSEQVRLDSGMVGDTYVPDGAGTEDTNNGTKGYKEKITNERSAIRFMPTASDYTNGDFGSFYSGFVTNANNQTGINMTVWSPGGAGFSARTYLLRGMKADGNPIYHRIKTSTTFGGNIQSTTNGNVGGQLNDGGTLLNPGTVTVPDGKTVVYTMKANAGYSIDDIVLYNGIGYDDGKKLSFGTEPAKMAIGSYQTVTIDNGKSGKLTRVSETEYTFEFPDNNADHTLHVAWTPTPVVVKVTKSWDDIQNHYGTRQDVTLHVDAIGVYVNENGRLVKRDYKDILPAQDLSKNATGNDLKKTWGVGTYTPSQSSGSINMEDSIAALPQTDDKGNGISYNFVFTNNGLQVQGKTVYYETTAYENLTTHEIVEALPGDDGYLPYTDVSTSTDTIYEAANGTQFKQVKGFVHSTGAFTKELPTKDSGDNALDVPTSGAMRECTTIAHYVNSLPLFDADGNRIRYVIRETLPDGTTVGEYDVDEGLLGYTTSYAELPITKTDVGSVNADTYNNTVNNKLGVLDEDEHTEIKVDKKWYDDGVNTNHTEREIADSFRLFQNGTDITDVVYDASNHKSKLYDEDKYVSDEDNEIVYKKVTAYKQTAPTTESYKTELPIYRSADGKAFAVYYEGDPIPNDAVQLAFAVNDAGDEYSFTYIDDNSSGTEKTAKFTRKDDAYQKVSDGSIIDVDPVGDPTYDPDGKLKKGLEYITITGSGKNWTYEVEGLPTHTLNQDTGKVEPAKYHVKEDDSFKDRYMEPHYTEIDKAEDEGTVTNNEMIIIKATKHWEDNSDSLGDRKDIVLHLDATVKAKSGNADVTGKIEDILPPQQIKKGDGDTVTKTWGDNKSYKDFNPDDTDTDDKVIIYTSDQIAALKDADNKPLIFAWDITSKGVRYESVGGRTSPDLPGQTTFVVNKLPRYDSTGNEIVYSIRETLTDGKDVVADNVDLGLKGYITSIDDWSAFDMTRDSKNLVTKSGKVLNTHEVTGTFGLNLVKEIAGRPFADNDKFSFTLTAENGAPMPLKKDSGGAQVPGVPSGDEDVATASIYEGATGTDYPLTTGTTRATAKFKTMVVTNADLKASDITYGADNVTETERDSVRYWTVTDGDDVTTYDMSDPAKKSAFLALSEAKRNSATGKVYSNKFVYYITETPTNTGSDNKDSDSPFIKNDTSKQKVVVEVLFDQINLKIMVSGQDATVTSTSQTEIPAKVEVDPVYFKNEYKANANWDPVATKTLDGRPLERDQFKFKLKSMGASDDQNTPSPMPEGNIESNDDDGRQIYEKDGEKYYYTPADPDADPAVEEKLEDEEGNVVTGFDLDDYTRVMKTDIVDNLRQDVEKDKDATNKETNDLYGPVTFGGITYTNEDLKKEVKYSEADAATKKKVTRWTSEDGKTVYGPIPDDAKATITTPNGETKNGKDVYEKDGARYYYDPTDDSLVDENGDPVTEFDISEYTRVMKTYDVTYAKATDEERKIAKGTTTDSLWKKDDVTYIDPGTSVTIPGTAKGTYYMDSRTYKYKMWEVKDEDKDYGVTEYDTHISEATAYEIEVTLTEQKDGTLKVEVNKTKDDLLFENEYEAEGILKLSIIKKLEGANDATETNQKAEFTLEAVTQGAPMPKAEGEDPGNKETLEMSQANKDKDGETTLDQWTVAFKDIKFTHKDLMGTGDNANNYVASRTKDGLYERTFVYKITEKSMTPSENGGVTSDPKTLMVSVTVQEDAHGNITVVAVNGLDGANIKDPLKLKVTPAKEAVPAQGEQPAQDAEPATSEVTAGEFTNKYQANNTATLKATKKLYGDNLVDGQFEFVLKDEQITTAGDNKVIQGVTNTADGKVTFRTITYNLDQLTETSEPEGTATTNAYGVAKGKKYKVFTYTIKEVKPHDKMDNEAYEYGKAQASDTAKLEQKVHVLVYDKGDGTLVVKYSLKDNPTKAEDFKDELKQDDVTINNMYTAKGEAPIEGTKELQGRTLKNEEFEFTITPDKVYEEDGTTEISGKTSPAPVDGTGAALTSVKNKADGSIDFGTVKFTMEDLKNETTSGGTITYDNKRVFTYKLKEKQHSDGSITDWDLDERTVTVTVENNGDGTLTVTPAYTTGSDKWTNKVELIDIEVTKTWYGVATDDVKVTMQQKSGVILPSWDDVDFEDKDWTHTFTSGEFTTDGKNDKTYTFEGLQKYDESGDAIEYRVHEDAAPEGAKYLIAQNDAESGENYTVINVNRETMEVDATKVWNDNQDQDGKRAAAKFTLTNNGEQIASGNLPTGTTAEQTVSVPETGDAKDVTWNVYKYFYSKSGDTITFSKPTYKIKETTVPTGYTVTPAGTTATESGLVDDGGTITNSYTPEKASILVTKKWDDDSNREDRRKLDPAKVYLYKKVWTGGTSGSYGAETLVSVDPKIVPTTADSTNETAVPSDATYTWNDLPVYENGRKILYIVKEEHVAGYATTYDHKAGETGTYDPGSLLNPLTTKDQIALMKDQIGNVKITNELTLSHGKINVDKVWDDEEDKYGMRPDSVEFTLYDKSSGEKKKVTKDVDGNDIVNPVTLDGTADTGEANGREEEAWKATWSKLPEYAENDEQKGVAAQYVIEETYEDTALEENGYSEPVVTYGGTEGEGLFGFKKVDLIKVTNSYVPETTSADAEKSWDDNSNHDGIRPNFIVLTLQESHWDPDKEGGAGYTSAADVVPARTLTLTNADSANSWTGSIDGLPKMMNGKEIKYSFTEKTVPQDYTKTSETTTAATETAVAKTTVTNKHDKFVGTVEVTKIWEDQDNRYGKRPTTAEFKDMVQLKDDDGNPAKDAEGNTVEPSVTQATGDANKNKYVVKWENVLVYKADDRSSGDKIVYSIEETGLNAGYEIVGQLPKNIKLTRVTDEESDDYGKWLLQDGIELTNKLTTLDLPLRKIWIDYDVDETSEATLENIRPASVTLRVTADAEMEDASGTALAGWTVSDGSSYIDVSLNAENKIDDTTIRTGAVWYKLDDRLMGLPVYKADGTTAINYTISEPNVPANYEQKNALTNDTNAIVNVYKGVKFTGTKVWKDGKEHNTAKELSGSLVLHRDWTPAGETLQTETVDNFHIDWTGDTFVIIGLPEKTVNGDTYTYWVSEDVPDGYKVKYSVKTHGETDAEDGIMSGGTITNTPKVGDATIAKKFVDKDDNLIPKAQLPAGFKIKVKYVSVNDQGETVDRTAELTIGDKTPETSGDYEGFYKWTIENVASGSTLSAEEYGYQNPTGYVYDSTTVDIRGQSYKQHPDVNPNYAELVMPAGAATRSAVSDSSTSIAFTNVYETATQDIWVRKVWNDQNDADGIRPYEITLTLKAYDSANDPIAVLPNATSGGNKVSERDFTFDDDTYSGATVWADRDTFKDLPIYDSKGGQIKYVLTEKEANIPIGYTASSDVQTELSPDSISVIQITNTHTPETADVNVTKTWTDDSDSAGLRQPTTVYLYKQVYNGSTYGTATLVGKVVEGKIKIADSNNVEVDWSDLPVIENGRPIRYSVKEAHVKHYTTTVKYTNDDTNVTTGTDEDSYLELGYLDTDEDSDTYGDVIKTDGTAEITNEYDPGSRELEVTKKWDDADNVDGKRPDTITVKIKAEFADGTAAKVFGEGSSKSASKDITLGIDSTATIDKKFAVVDENTWKWTYVGDSSDPNYSGFDLPEYVDDEGKVVEPTDPKGSNGREVFYYIEEEEVDEYTTVITRTAAGKYEITNSYEPETTTATITKKWEDNSDAAGLRPNTLTMQLWRTYEKIDGTIAYEPAKDADEKTVKDLISEDDKKGSDKNTWEYTVDNLPENILLTDSATGDKVSKPVTYYWKETVPTNYTAERTGDDPTPGETVGSTICKAGNGKTITNTLTTFKLEVEKIWADGDNRDSVRPDSVPLTLEKTTDNPEAATASWTAVTIPAGTITNPIPNNNNKDGSVDLGSMTLPAYEDGKLVHYRLKEDNTSLAANGYTITHTVTGVTGSAAGNEAVFDYENNVSSGTTSVQFRNEHTTTFTVTKKWVDKEENTVRPSTSDYEEWLILYAGNDPAVDGSGQALKPTVTASGNVYTATWTNLPSYDGDDAIVYTAVEKNGSASKIPGYDTPVYSNVDKSKTDKAYDNGVITNKQLIKVDVVKEWNDNNNHDNQRPDKIKVTLYRNGVQYGSEATLKESDATVGTNTQTGNDTWTWTGVWKDLPYVDENGSVYNYTATETGLGDSTGLWGMLTNESTIRQILLTTWNTAKDTLTFNVTNTDDEDKIGFTVDKIWDDANDTDDLRPEKIYYKLYKKIGESGTEEYMSTLPDGATVKTSSNTDDTIADADYDTNGYVEVDANKADVTQGTLNRVILDGLPKYERVNKGTQDNPDWETIEIIYTIKEDAVPATAAIDPVPGYNLSNTGQMPVISDDFRVGLTVTNDHTPVTADVSESFKKLMTGRDFRSDDKFKFLIEPKDNGPRPARDYVTVTNVSSGRSTSVSVPAINITGDDVNNGGTAVKLSDLIENPKGSESEKSEKFTYELREVYGGKVIDDVAYDSSVLTLEVTVKWNAVTKALETTQTWKKGTETVTGDDISFTNRYSKVGTLTLRKAWVDRDADETSIVKRPDSVKIRVTADKKPAETGWTETGEGADKKYYKDYTLGKNDTDTTKETDDVWKKETEQLPKTDENGDAITYTVSEPEVPENYVDPAIIRVLDVFTVINKYETITLEGTKQWIDGGKEHDNATEVRLTVHYQAYDANDEPVGEPGTFVTSPDDAHIDWDKDNKNKFKVIGLPEFDKEGNKYEYWISEEAIEGYDTEYTVKTHSTESTVDGVTDGGTITNKIKQEPVEINGNKVWIGGENDEHNNNALGLTLYRQSAKSGSTPESGAAIKKVENTGTPAEPVWVVGDTAASVEWDADEGDSDYSYSDLPKYDAEGYEYTYWVVEGTVPQNYSESYSNDADHLNATDKVYDEGTITNTSTKKDSITVSKTWDDRNDAEGLRPGKVVVHLYKKVTEAQTNKTVQVEVEKKEITGSDWADVTWTDLPVYDADGNKIEYQVVEENEYGYTTTYKTSGSDYSADDNKLELDGNTTADPQEVKVKNSLVPATSEVKVEKEWLDNDNVDGIRPDEVTVELYARIWNKTAGEYGDEDKAQRQNAQNAWTDVEQLTLKKSEGWEDSWTNLPRIRNGKTVLYSVHEVTTDSTVFGPDKYDTEYVVTGDQTDGFKVTNTHKQLETTANVTKVWDDKSNILGTRPKKLTMQLMRKYTDKDGQPKTESVTADVNGDTVKSEISADDEDPDSDTWKWTVKHLPQKINVNTGTDAAPVYVSRDITYFWKETVPVGYSASGKFNGDNVTDANGFISVDDKSTVTNSIKTGKIVLTKTWNDVDDRDDLRPDDGEFIKSLTLYMDEIEGEGRTKAVVGNKVGQAGITVTASQDAPENTTIVTYDNVPVYDADGEARYYEIVEGTIEGYSLQSGAVLSGTMVETPAGSGKFEKQMTAVNKHVPGTTAITVTKEWDDNDNEDNARPTIDEFKATMRLYADDDDKTSTYAKDMTVVDNGDGTFTVTWSNLPKKKGSGASSTDIVYTVKEDLTDAAESFDYYGDDPEYSNKAPHTDEDDKLYDKGTVTNRQMYRDIEVTNVWVDRVNDLDDGKLASGIRPENITVSIIGADGSVLKDAGGNDLTKVIAAGTPGENASDYKTTTVFKKVPIYKTDGKTKETPKLKVNNKDSDQVPNYTTKIDNDKMLITNIYKVGEITGTKVWRDDVDTHSNKDELTLTVKYQAYDATGTKVGDEGTVTDPHIDWDGDSYTVIGLPESDNNGNRYTYWVVEKEVDGYEDPLCDNSASTGTTAEQKAETDKAYNGGKIINSALTSITVTKKWDDAKYFEGEAATIGDANEYVRPAVTFTVTATATTTDEIKALTDAGFTQDSTEKTKYTKEVELTGQTAASVTSWTETITDLPMYDQEGKPIKYTSAEKNASGADTTPEGFVKEDDEADRETINTPKEKKENDTLDLTVLKTDGITSTGLNGARFTVYQSNGRTEATTGVNGMVAVNPVTTAGEGDNAGKATVTFKKPGTYVIKETRAPKGYTLSEKSFTIQVDEELESITLKKETDSEEKFWTWLYKLLFNKDGSTDSFDEDKLTLSVPNDPIRAEVLVEKIWDDANDQDGLRKKAKDEEALPKVKLQYKLGEGEWTDATAAILGEQTNATSVPYEGGKVRGGKSYTWNDLPAYLGGEEVTYRVVETGIITGYDDPAYSVDSFKLANSAGTMADNAEVTVTNSYEPVTATVQVSKKWADIDNLDRKRVDELSFKLVSDNGYEKTKDLAIKTDVEDGVEAIDAPTGDENYSKWIKLPVYKANGEKIKYTLTETTKIDGYTVEYAGTDTTKKNVEFVLDPDSDDPYLVTVTNEHIPDAIRVWVKKEWNDNNDQDGMRGEVTIRLKKASGSAGDYDGKDKDGNTVDDLKLNDSNSYRGKFENLKAVDANGKIITYTVEEIAAPDGYDVGDAQYSGSGTHAEPFVVTNSRNADTVKVTATKTWEGDEEFKDETRKDVTLHLIGRKGDGIAWDGGSQTIKLADGDPAEWTGLPRNIDGTELVWEVYEDAVPGYVMTLSGDGKPDTDGNVKFTVTNTYVGAVAEITATKQWEDDNNRDGIRKDVYFQLYRTVGYDGTEEPVGKPEKVKVDETAGDGEAAGSVKWNGLPEVLTEPDTEYVAVSAVAGDNPSANGWYELKDGEYEKSSDTVVDPEKTYYESDGTEYTEVSSAITGDNPSDRGWFEKDDQGDYNPTEDTSVDSDKTYYEAVEYDQDRAVIYTVKEVDENGNVTAPSGYESIVTQTSAGEFVVTNIHTPYTTELSVQKLWADEDDVEGLRPDHLKIRLKHGNDTVRETVLTYKDEGKGWNSGYYTFEGLLKNEDGEPIDYKVVELDSDESTELDGTEGKDETSYGYKVSIVDGEGTSENPIVIVNEHEKGSDCTLTVTKKWEGDEKHKSTRGDVNLHLVKVIDGARSVVEGEDKTIKFDSKKPDKAMTAKWTGLPTREKGKAVVYTVEEFDVPAGYKVSVSDSERDDDNNYTVTVTNTYSETPVFGEDVIYIDPLNPAGKMALKSTTYDTHAEAQGAANNKTGAPGNPKHSGYKFTGWAVNYDANGNFILVATYSQTPVKEKTTSYIDPQSGEPLLVSEVTDNPGSVIPPKDPKHPNLVFIGWKKVTDASGNTMFVAEYGCECSNGSPKSVDKSNVNTGDDNMLYVWIWILLLSAASFVMTAMMRNRSFDRTDGYKPRH